MKITDLRDYSIYELSLKAENFVYHSEKALTQISKESRNIEVEREKTERLLEGIKNANLGREQYFSPYGGLYLENAINIFSKIPGASTLLAISYTDLAAHFEITCNWYEADLKSSQALKLLSGIKGLEASKAFASRIRGARLYIKGNFEFGCQYFNQAREYYKALPNCNEFTKILDEEEIIFQAMCKKAYRKRIKKWWHFWKYYSPI